MAWQAHTTFLEVGIRTSFRLIQSPTVPGYPAEPLKVGAKMSVEFADNSRTELTIVTASSDAVIFSISDDTVWRMTPRGSGDVPSSFNTKNLHYQDWVVREQIRPDTTTE
jgi:hypothetical protein